MARKKATGKKAGGKKRPIETYEHKKKKRANNPPVGLVTPDTDPDTGTKQTYQYDPHLDPQLNFDARKARDDLAGVIEQGLDAGTLEEAKAALKTLKKSQEPYLNWAGKAEHTSFEVPTVSLHVHERIDPRSIIEAVRKRNGEGVIQGSLFEMLDENPPLRQAIEFYKHAHGWSNRMIAGDSLLVMNSLLEKEGMAGKVQMIYVDPPYGIKYGSNFQPFVNKRDVKDGRDEDLTTEPEQVRAFRDTWELGIHSYLTYLRDRLLLARELLTESGSVFVQISDENVHHVRELMDEVLGVGNFCSVISFRVKSPLGVKYLGRSNDFLVWYAKDIQQMKYRQIYLPKNVQEQPEFSLVELHDGTRLTVSECMKSLKNIPADARYFTAQNLASSGYTESCTYSYRVEGNQYDPPRGRSWKTTIDGMKRLETARRLMALSGSLRYVYFLDDFPVQEVSNLWLDTFAEPDKRYVVQTAQTVIQRCLLMTTDPGDLVFDPTCGSGTTAYVAEQWGRRWITCDTSRVALTLAKQRLMTAVFNYYELAHPNEGVDSGFVYETVPHVTLKSIANNEPPGTETLYDKPFVDGKRTRVSGPFTVEAVPAPAVRPVEELLDDSPQPADSSVARSGETLRQSEWRDELLRTGIRGKAGQYIRFARLEPMPGCRWIHADGETRVNNDGANRVREKGAAAEAQRIVVSFGPEHAPLEQRQVALAIEEAQTLVPKPKLIAFATFQFDDEAAKDIDETNWPGVTLLKVQMNADLLTDDLKKKRASNESFWLIGQPDVRIERIEKGDYKGRFRVRVDGFDYYNTKTGGIESGGSDRIAVWLLDPDYDGRSLFPRQVFFPMAGEKEGWAKLAKNLKAEIDEDLIEAYRGTVSLPFAPGEHKRVAVKIVDDRGIESLRVMELDT